MPLSVIFDHAQRRLSHDRIAVIAGGLDFNGPYFENVYIDPVSNTLMLEPGWVNDAWFTQNTGRFAKYAFGDMTFSDPSVWYADDKLGLSGAAGYFFSSSIPDAGWMKTPVLPANKGIYLSIFSNTAGDRFKLAEFGYGDIAEYTTAQAFRLWSDGAIEVWEEGVFKGTYNLSGSITGSQQAQVEISFAIIPFRKRELLFVSRNGNGFIHVIDSIDEDEENPVITPEGKFWFQMPTAQTQVQIAPINYPTAGYGTSIPFQLSEAPEGSDTLEEFTNPAFAGGAGSDWQIFGDGPYAGSPTTDTQASLVAPDGTAFTANGSNKDCRIKVEITGDGAFTPFVYAAQVAYAAVFDNTDASEETEADDYLEVASLDVPDSATQVTASIQVFNPAEVESTLVSGLRRIGNRPIKFESDSVVWLDGLGMAPSWNLSTSEDTERMSMEIRDHWKSLESYQFRTMTPLEGQTLTQALRFLLKRTGLEDSDLDLEEVDFLLRSVPGSKAGDFSIAADIGDTAADWIQRLIDTYAHTFHYGFEPTSGGIKFVFKSPATIESQPFEFELWPTITDAITAGKSVEEAFKFVYRKYEEETTEVLANDYWVTGKDPRTGRAIQTHYPDVQSQDPTLAPSARPDNWVGEPRLFGIADDSITTQEACDRCAVQIYDLLSPVEVLAEIECEMMIKPDGIPMWRGHDVWLHGKGRYRIRSFGVDIDKEATDTDTWQWREAQYCLKRITPE